MMEENWTTVIKPKTNLLDLNLKEYGLLLIRC